MATATPLAGETTATARAHVTAWSPLRHRVFLGLWITSIVSNTGTWVQNVGAAWMMGELGSPALVAMVQTATSLPVFFLALPAGALADIVDRRRLLLWTQGWALAAAATLGTLSLIDLVTPIALLLFTLLVGVGVAAATPAFQAVVPDVVPREELPAAVALASVANNIARAVGPAIGGVVVAVWSPGMAFLVNALSFVGTLVVVHAWAPLPPPRRRGPEHLLVAVRSGLHYARHAPALQIVLVRTTACMLGASALWALLPVRAQHGLGMDARGYGSLLASLGIGALLGAALLARVRRRSSADGIVAGATLVFAVVTWLLGVITDPAHLAALLVVGGGAWMALVSTFNVAAQTSAPAWVKARALAVYLLASQGATAVGSLAWGLAAQRAGTSTALTLGAVGLASSLLLTRRLAFAGTGDLEPTRHWAEPEFTVPLSEDGGPVIVTVEYHVAPGDAPRFRTAIGALRRIRLRDGAIFWTVMADVGDPWRHVEFFLLDSWLEHLRQHDRVTRDDLAVEDAVRRFHQGPGPHVSHYIGGDWQPPAHGRHDDIRFGPHAHAASGDERMRRDAALDRTIEASFPASDPPSSLPDPDDRTALPALPRTPRPDTTDP